MQTKRRTTAAPKDGVKLPQLTQSVTVVRLKGKLTQSVTVVRSKGKNVGITLRIEFDPKAVGDERALRVYNGLAQMLAGLLSPEEAAEFLNKLAAAKEKSCATRA
jgi:ribosomal protein L10